MKRIVLLITLLLFTLCFSSISSAQSMADRISNITYDGEVKKVAVLVEMPVEYINNKDVRKIIDEKMANTFKSPKFEILPYEESQIARLNYCEEHGIPEFSYRGYDEGDALSIYDLKNIGKELSADYVVYISMVTSQAQYSDAVFSSTSSASAKCDVRLIGMDNEKYLYRDTFIKEGKSTSFLIAGPGTFAPKKAYIRAIKGCIDEINIDSHVL